MDSSRALRGWSPAFDYDAAHRLIMSPESYRMLHAAIDAAIAEAVLAERHACADVAANACLVPPDGGSPTEEERLVCEEASARIMARSVRPVSFTEPLDF